jgi:hypothetical protein
MENIDPFTYVTKASHTKAVFENNYLPKETLYYVNEFDTKWFIRPCFFGGHTDSYCNYYKCKPTEKIVIDDICSEYPTVMCEDPLPGAFIEQRTQSYKSKIFMSNSCELKPNLCNTYLKNLTKLNYVYFAVVDISEPKKVTNFPAAPVKCEISNKLVFPNGELTEKGLYSTELEYLMKEEKREIKRVVALAPKSCSDCSDHNRAQPWFKPEVVRYDRYGRRYADTPIF